MNRSEYNSEEEEEEIEEEGPEENEKNTSGETIFDDEKTIENIGEAAFESDSFNQSLGEHQRRGTAASITSTDSTILSAFTSDVAETMHILRDASIASQPQPPLARMALSAVRTMCKDRFEAKKRLGNSGAAEHLLDILRIYRKDPSLLLLACETISEFMLNENDNKIFMGAVGLVHEILPTYDLCQHSPSLQAALVKLAIDCCHNKIKGLLVKYTKPKRPQSRGTTPLTDLYPDYLNIDNRAKLGEIGFCQILIQILNEYVPKKRDQEIDDSENVLKLTAKAISTLSTNEYNAGLFGELGCCDLISRFLSHKYCDISIRVVFLWDIIILCADAGNENQMLFGQKDILKVLMDLLHEVQRAPSSFVKHSDFSKYMEYLAWSLMNLIRHSPENMQKLRNVTYAQVVIDNILSIDEIPKAAKIKLNQVFIDVYEKFYLDESKLSSGNEELHNVGVVDKVYLTQAQPEGLLYHHSLAPVLEEKGSSGSIQND